MRKKLTRKQYAEKFEKLNYIFQDGEVIKQCIAPYPCYWFVSNCGYVLSLHGKKVKKLASATLESPIKTFIKMSGKIVRMTIIEA